ncbi:MAG TPA: DUF6600 domain-containing protein, partial [Casimicrobiaceae bacterium]
MRKNLQQWRNGMMTAVGAMALLFCGAALADPPGRVARLTQMGGTITFSPAGEDDWSMAQPNRPVVAGDRLWADAASRFELQIGAAALRAGSETSVNILNLDDNIAQFQLAQGTINLRVRFMSTGQIYEIDTPNVAFSIHGVGEYRVDVDPAGNTTLLRVFTGEGEAWGEGAPGYVVGAGQQYTFVGDGLRDYSVSSLPPPDEFDRWAFDRDRREEQAASARFVPPEMVGYSDLDEYGAWRNVEGYGNVWVPTAVAVGWAPYHYGRWAWIEPWGWTWIDDAPWGFAPFHYGRWAYVSSRWCWVPGPVAVRPVYAPALVAFIGGSGFSLSLAAGGGAAGVAWFPLGFGEVYQPAYTVSRTYFTNVNVSNTVINRTVVNNYYNNVNVTNVVYRNRDVAGAVTAVPTAAFASGRQVAPAAVAVSQETINRAPVNRVAPVAPSRASLVAAAAAGAAAVAVAKPSAGALTRRAIVKTPPPAATPSFSSRAELLATQPGRPLEADKLNSVRAQKGAVERNFKVAAPSGATASRPLPSAGPGAGAGTGSPSQQQRALGAERAGPPTSGGAPRPPQDRGSTAQERRGPPPSGTPGDQERAARGDRSTVGETGRAPTGTPGAQGQQQPQVPREDRRGPPPQPGAAPPRGDERPASAQFQRQQPQQQPQPQQPPVSREDRRGGPQAGTGPQAGPGPQPRPEGRPPSAPLQSQPQQQQQQQTRERQQAQRPVPQPPGKGDATREEGKSRER